MTYHAYPGAVPVIDLTVSDSEASDGGSDVDAAVIRHGQMNSKATTGGPVRVFCNDSDHRYIQ